jgi:hypothetical protein
LRKPFENIIIFRKTFSEHLKTIIKAGTQNKAVSNTKEQSLPQSQARTWSLFLGNFSLKLNLMDLSLKTLRKGSGSPEAHQGKEEGVRNERRGGLFIGKVCHQLSDRAADVW